MTANVAESQAVSTVISRLMRVLSAHWQSVTPLPNSVVGELHVCVNILATCQMTTGMMNLVASKGGAPPPLPSPRRRGSMVANASSDANASASLIANASADRSPSIPRPSFGDASSTRSASGGRSVTSSPPNAMPPLHLTRQQSLKTTEALIETLRHAVESSSLSTASRTKRSESSGSTGTVISPSSDDVESVSSEPAGRTLASEPRDRIPPLQRAASSSHRRSSRSPSSASVRSAGAPSGGASSNGNSAPASDEWRIVRGDHEGGRRGAPRSKNGPGRPRGSSRSKRKKRKMSIRGASTSSEPPRLERVHETPRRRQSVFQSDRQAPSEQCMSDATSSASTGGLTRPQLKSSVSSTGMLSNLSSIAPPPPLIMPGLMPTRKGDTNVKMEPAARIGSQPDAMQATPLSLAAILASLTPTSRNSRRDKASRASAANLREAASTNGASASSTQGSPEEWRLVTGSSPKAPRNSKKRKLMPKSATPADDWRVYLPNGNVAAKNEKKSLREENS